MSHRWDGEQRRLSTAADRSPPLTGIEAEDLDLHGRGTSAVLTGRDRARPVHEEPACVPILELSRRQRQSLEHASGEVERSRRCAHHGDLLIDVVLMRDERCGAATPNENGRKAYERERGSPPRSATCSSQHESVSGYIAILLCQTRGRHSEPMFSAAANSTVRFGHLASNPDRLSFNAVPALNQATSTRTAVDKDAVQTRSDVGYAEGEPLLPVVPERAGNASEEDERLPRGAPHGRLADCRSSVTRVAPWCTAGRDDVDREASAVAPATERAAYTNVLRRETQPDVSARGGREEERKYSDR